MDWIDFLNQRGIEYVTHGHGLAGNNIAIQCPFCGSVGRPFHLHISLDGRGWHCWREADRRGSDTSLIQHLINCSWREAKQIAGTSTFLPDDFAAKVRNLLAPVSSKPTKNSLRLLKEFKPLAFLPSCRPFIKYLDNRGFSKIDLLYDQYALRYCTYGPFHHRIVFPIHMDGRLISWTGRAIFDSMEPRYKTLSHDPEKAHKNGLPPAVAPIKNCLLWYDHLLETDADTLIICEGPFDSLRVRWIGETFGITSTCFFTNKPSNIQIDLLHTVVPKFKKRYLILDRLAEAKSIALGSELQSLGIVPKYLPPHRKDPGEITLKELVACLDKH